MACFWLILFSAEFCYFSGKHQEAFSLFSRMEEDGSQERFFFLLVAKQEIVYLCLEVNQNM
jgi:hypothetical protein